MSSDYQVFFSPSSLDRKELFERIFPIIKLSGLKFKSVCYQLAWDTDIGEYRYTIEKISVPSLRDGLIATVNWQSVSFPFEFTWGPRSMLFWRDRHSNREVLSFEDSSSLFVNYSEDEIAWKWFEETILDIVEAIEASFCICKRDPILDTLYEDDIVKAIYTDFLGETQTCPLFLVIHDKLVSPNKLATIKNKCNFRLIPPYSVIKAR
jgi:hypothetical protein